MNILLINHYAGSIYHGMEYRPYYMAREWLRNGHQVTIVAASFSHVRSQQPTVKQICSEEYIDGIRYVWIKTPNYSGNGIKRVINIFCFVFLLLLKAGFILNGSKPDAVIASSTYPLDTIPGRIIASRYKAKLIYEVHDLWPLSLIELGGMSPLHPFVLLIKYAEMFAYRYSDQVISLLPNAETHMRERGLKPNKFFYVPNGIDLTEWEGPYTVLPGEHQEIIQKLRVQKNFLVCYAGAHGIANDLSTLIKAAEKLGDYPVTILLVGQGPEKKQLQAEALKKNLQNVVFLPPVPKACMPALLSNMDLLYIGLKKEPIFRFGVSPNKVMDYMMAGKPVLYAVESSNNPVSESGCGICIPSSDPEAVCKSILNVLVMTDSQRQQMGIQGTKYILEKHTYVQLSKLFISALESVTVFENRESSASQTPQTA